MALLYTTKEAIANRLKGRLVVGGSQVPFQPTTVDDNLLEQIGEQVEARVKARLKTVYRLPLTSDHSVLASVVEKGVICELMGTHFVGQEGSEEGGFGRMMCSQFASELNDIINGTIGLDGETLATGSEVPIASNLTIAGQRAPIVSPTRQDAGTVQW